MAEPAFDLEVKSALTEHNRALKALQDTLDGQKKADVVLEEKVARINSAVDASMDKVNATIKDLQKKADDALSEIAHMKRSGAGAGGEENELESKFYEFRDLHQKGFDLFLRKRDDSLLREAKKLADEIETKSGGSLIVEGADGRAVRLDTKSMSTVVAADGGFLVTPQLESEMIEILLETSPMRQIARVMTIGTKEVEFLVNRKGATASWTTELATRAETNTPTLSKVKLGTDEIMAFPVATLSMLEDGEIDVEAWIAGEVTEAIANKENDAFLNGDGVEKPKGLLTYTKVAASSYDANTNWGSHAYIATGTSGAFGASYPGSSSGPTASANGADKLFDVTYDLKAAFRANASWLMSRRTMGAVRKLKDGDGSYLFRSELTESGLIPTLLGYPIDEAEDMPEIGADAFAIAFGDFNKAYIILDRLGIMVIPDEVTLPGSKKWHFRKRVGGAAFNYDAVKFLKFGTS
jgi:HK97 family phage major capsid protein